MKHNRQNATVAKVLVLIALILMGASSMAMAEPVWIDVRTAEEHAQDNLPGAKHIPHSEIAVEIEKLELSKDAEIKLFCRSGNRAGIAKKTLEELGYSNVDNVGGLEDAKRLAAGDD